MTEPEDLGGTIRTVQHRERSLRLTGQLGQIDLDNLSDEVSAAGAHALWWGVLAAEAQADVESAKIALDTTRARVARAYRQHMASLAQKVTEPMVEEAQTLDQEVQAAQRALVEAGERASVLRAVAFAVSGKQRTLEAMAGMIGQDLYARGWTGGSRAAQAERLRAVTDALAGPARRQAVTGVGDAG